ncbi:hypothetical protein [Bacillus ndiopicus]|uniref:hypothetical protein n=1 Tax=Bacillus ndiopicus TaxID=1347368 RepID=UPI0005AA989F|nr:hypothetical protein [Bacillus ndiopicus]
MFDFKQLAVKPSKEKKEQQYRLLEERLQKKKTALLPTVLLPLSMLIAFLLFITFPTEQFKQTATAESSIVEILGTLGDGNPSSIYRFGVKNITSDALISSFERALSEMQPITVPKNTQVTYAIQLKYADRTVERYYMQWAERSYIYFKDAKEQWFVIDDVELYQTFAALYFPITERSSMTYIVILLLVIVLKIAERHIWQQGHDGKKLKLYSTIWQHLIDACIILIIFVTLLMKGNPSVFWSLLCIVIGWFLKIKIESSYTNEAWRYKIMIYRFVLLLIVWYFIIYQGVALS